MTDISIRIHMLVTSAVALLAGKLKREEGQDLIEYAMLGGLIAAALVAIGVLGAYTGGVQAMATGIKNCIDFNTATSCKAGF